MSIAFSVLASGSSGNAAVLRRSAAAPALIDAGLSPRRTAEHLGALGVGLEDVRDVFVTHLDQDHFHRGWCKALPKLGATAHVHRRHQRAALRAGLPARHTHFYDRDFSPDDGLCVRPILMAHDALGSVALALEHRGCRLGWATDVGRVPQRLYDIFIDLDGLAIESNYDRGMQVTSLRPEFLKARIMGGAGHLSNRQALDAIVRITARSSLAHVVLLHVSQECNHPRRIRSLFRHEAPGLLPYLTIAEQDRPTPWLELTPGRRRTADEQLALFKG